MGRENFTIPIIQMGARVYLPTAGRFLQVDPIEGGTLNAYVYVTDPVNGHDYSGLCAYIIQCTATIQYIQPAAPIKKVQPAANVKRTQNTLPAKKTQGLGSYVDPNGKPSTSVPEPPPLLSRFATNVSKAASAVGDGVGTAYNWVRRTGYTISQNNVVQKLGQSTINAISGCAMGVVGSIALSYAAANAVGVAATTNPYAVAAECVVGASFNALKSLNPSSGSALDALDAGMDIYDVYTRYLP